MQVQELYFLFFNKPFLLSGFVQICLLSTDANKDKLLNSESVWMLFGYTGHLHLLFSFYFVQL